MNIPEFYVQRWESEQGAFARVLRAIPENQLDYRPHERSTSAGNLAWQLAVEQRALCELLNKGEYHWDTRPRPKTIDEIIAAWDAATADLRKNLASLDEAKNAAPAKLSMSADAAWTDTIENMLWGFLFDMVHHRGQLSAYLRPMGGKVPSIYGPSADDTSS